MPAKAKKIAKATPSEAEEPVPAQAVKQAAAVKKTTAAKAAKPSAKAVRPPAAEATPDPGEGAASEEEFAPMNRAERRAKGRGKSIVQAPGGRGKVTGSHGPAHTQRNWANRRTG